MHEHLSSVLHILLRSCPLYDVLIDCLHHCVCLYIRPKLRRCSVLSRRRASSWTRTSTGRWIIYCAVPAHNVDLAVAGLSVCVSECVDSLDCPGRCARALAFAENSLKVAASPRGFASRRVRACWSSNPPPDNGRTRFPADGQPSKGVRALPISLRILFPSATGSPVFPAVPVRPITRRCNSVNIKHQ